LRNAVALITDDSCTGKFLNYFRLDHSADLSAFLFLLCHSLVLNSSESKREYRENDALYRARCNLFSINSYILLSLNFKVVDLVCSLDIEIDQVQNLAM